MCVCVCAHKVSMVCVCVCVLIKYLWCVCVCVCAHKVSMVCVCVCVCVCVLIKYLWCVCVCVCVLIKYLWCVCVPNLAILLPLFSLSHLVLTFDLVTGGRCHGNNHLSNLKKYYITSLYLSHIYLSLSSGFCIRLVEDVFTF